MYIKYTYLRYMYVYIAFLCSYLYIYLCRYISKDTYKNT